jgi:hypothetical protein
MQGGRVGDDEAEGHAVMAMAVGTVSSLAVADIEIKLVVMSGNERLGGSVRDRAHGSFALTSADHGVEGRTYDQGGEQASDH